MLDARLAVRLALELQPPKWPVWQDREIYYDRITRPAADVRGWLDSPHARAARVLHSGWRDADLKWAIEACRTKDEYDRLAAEAQQAAEALYAAEEAMWAAAGDEVNEDDGRTAAEEMQRAIELSLKSDQELQRAIQLSLDYEQAAAAAPDE